MILLYSCFNPLFQGLKQAFRELRYSLCLGWGRCIICVIWFIFPRREAICFLGVLSPTIKSWCSRGSGWKSIVKSKLPLSPVVPPPSSPCPPGSHCALLTAVFPLPYFTSFFLLPGIFLLLISTWHLNTNYLRSCENCLSP